MKRTLLLLALLPLLASAPAGAAVFTVTKTADIGAACVPGHCPLCPPGDCSLSGAVAAANGTPGTDVIELPPGTYVLNQTGAGGLHVNDPLILVGRDAASTIIDGNGKGRVLDIGADTEIFGVTLRNGRTGESGGGVRIRNTGTSFTVVIRRSVISGNEAQGDESYGGGLFGDGEDAGRIVVIESTISDNRAGGYGGGLSAGENFALVNSTVSGNTAKFGGGGLHYVFDQPPTILGSTITGNRALLRSGGGILAVSPLTPGSAPHMHGSIVAGNTAHTDPDCAGMNSAGYNVIGVVDGGCGTSTLDRSGTRAAPLDPKLAPLAELGPTPAHALLADSPALGLVPASLCEPSDQLGLERTAPCDAGSVELADHPVCIPGNSVLCLQDGRFRVTASWSNPDGTGGEARAAPLTDDTGNYWFFAPDNLEIMIKVLDGCAVNEHWWIFSSGLTDRGVRLRVDDLVTGQTWTHAHKAGTTYEPRLDTSALDGCSLPAPSSIPGIPGTLDSGIRFAVLVPTKETDTLDGVCDRDCSLREAVAASNAREGLEIILLHPGVYTLSRPGRAEDGNATGDLDVTGDLLILGAGAGRTVIDGGGIDRVLDASAVDSRLEIRDTTIRNGRAELVNHLDSGAGGGVVGDDLTLVRCHVTGNRSATSGGGISGTTVTVRDTTVSDNEADFGGGFGFVPTLRLANVTVSGNRASSAGGGLIIDAKDQELTGVTITGNSAFDGGGLYVSYATCPSGICQTDFFLLRSLVAGNTATHGPDCLGMRAQNACNVIGIDDYCGHGPTDRAGTTAAPLDPRITALGDHGGPTPTHALLAGSPAIDLRPAAGCLASDQRGRPRPANLCDSGAFELLPGCQPDAATLCLGTGDRFRVTAHWSAHGQDGEGQPFPLALDTGSFWFFDPANVELTIKILDGCAVNDRFWVFASGLTDVGVDLTVEDTATGSTWTYRNPAGTPFHPRLDANALDICPVNP